MAGRLGGQLRVLPGSVIGWDMSGALALGAVFGVPPLAMAELLPVIEAVMVAKLNEQMNHSHGGRTGFQRIAPTVAVLGVLEGVQLRGKSFLGSITEQEPPALRLEKPRFRGLAFLDRIYAARDLVTRLAGPVPGLSKRDSRIAAAFTAGLP